MAMSSIPTPAPPRPSPREVTRGGQQTTTPLDISNLINQKDVSGLEAAIPRLKPRVFRATPWHRCLDLICTRWSEVEDRPVQQRLVNLLLSHGGDDNEVDRRLLLDAEIKTVGELEVRPSPDEFDDGDKVAFLIAEETFRSFPHLAWSSAPTTKRTVFHIAAEEGACRIIVLAKETVIRGEQSLAAIIRQNDCNGRTALELAVEKGRELAVAELLRLDPLQLEVNSNAGRIITSAVEGGMISIVKALVTNRFGLLTEEMFRKAIASTKVDTTTKLEILEFLIDCIPRESGLLRESTFLHHAVRKGQVKIVELLLRVCPELTTSYETSPSEPTGRSVLSYNNTEFKDAIRDLIVPVIIERNAISVIRELFADTSEKRKEVCLDLSAFTYDSSGLDRFVCLVKSDLTAARPRSQVSGDLFFKKFGNSLPLTQRNILMPLYESFLAHQATVKRLASLPAQEKPGSGESSPSHWSSQFQSGDTYPSSGLANESDGTSAVFEVEFERTLKYVELPAFDAMKATKREEARDILDWLRECKGVIKIFELRVTDSLYQPHSEEVIEQALRKFDVENLNWRRTDLSIDTIREAAPNVKRLSLYCSGNQAVLDHWTGERGIKSLGRKLEYVHITILKINDNISEARANLYKSRAEQRLAELRDGDSTWFEVVVDVWYPKENKRGGDVSRTNLLKPATITQLTYFLPKYEEFQASITSTHSTRIKVAILDSGVDRGLFTGTGRNITGASFVHNHGGSKESPWWLASDPHGSHIANIIAQIDPCCDFYIAKVTETKKELDINRVVQAIHWAIEQQVDIINLSLVLFVHNENLHRAIEAADAAGILVMCSTADQGYIRQDVWPAKYSKTTSNEFRCVFPIAACNAHGKLTEYSSDAHYTFQGEDVIASSVEGSHLESQRRVSGSSVATAMATGVTTLVLACHRILQTAPLEDRRQGVSSIPCVIIRNIFAKMCREQLQANAQKPWFVKPWCVFPARDRALNSVDPADYTLGEAEDVMQWVLEVFQHNLVET